MLVLDRNLGETITVHDGDGVVFIVSTEAADKAAIRDLRQGYEFEVDGEHRDIYDADDNCVATVALLGRKRQKLDDGTEKVRGWRIGINADGMNIHRTELLTKGERP